MRVQPFGRLLLQLILAVAAIGCNAAAQPFAYVSNQQGNNVSVVNLANGSIPYMIFYSAGGLGGLAITPNGAYLYVTAKAQNCVVVMSTASDSVVTTIP